MPNEVQQTQTNADTTGTTGGETGEALFEGASSEQQGTEQQTTQAGGEVQQTEQQGSAGAGETQQTQGTGLSKDDIGEILATALAKVGGETAQQTQQAPVQERQYTQEEFEQAFNVLKVSPELLAQLRNEDPNIATKAWHTIRDGMIKQAMTMAEYRIQQLIKEVRDNDLAPIQTFVSEQQAVSFRNDFFKDYPDLEQYESIVDAVAAKLSQSGINGKDRKEVMKLFADETNKIVTQLKTAGNGNQQQTTTQGTTKPKGGRMTTLTGGGQNTSGRGQAQQAKGPPGIEVFD